jgi:hypothetical protein
MKRRTASLACVGDLPLYRHRSHLASCGPLPSRPSVLLSLPVSSLPSSLRASPVGSPTSADGCVLHAMPARRVLRICSTVALVSLATQRRRLAGNSSAVGVSTAASVSWRSTCPPLSFSLQRYLPNESVNRTPGKQRCARLPVPSAVPASVAGYLER